MANRDVTLKKAEEFLTYLKMAGVRSVPVTKQAIEESVVEEVKQTAVIEEDATDKRGQMLKLYKKVKKCVQCQDLAETRTNIVFGAGNVNANLVFIGEAPGRDEDMEGLPFVGRSGKLLTKIIEAIGINREDVFICNVLKCRPPENRNPLPEEIINCQPYLKKQLAIIKPKVICCLGKFACQTLFQTEDPISKFRGKWHTYEGIKTMPTYHPAYLLRNPKEKATVWEDMKEIMRELEKN